MEVKEVTTSKTTLELYNFPLHYMISCLCGLTAGGTSFRCVLRGRQVRGHTSILVRAPHTACDPNARTHLNNNISLFVLHKGNYSHRNTNLYEEAGDLSAQPGRCSMHKRPIMIMRIQISLRNVSCTVTFRTQTQKILV